MSEVSERANCFAIINTANGDEFAIEASGDRIIIQEDKMRIGCECKVCDGEGVIDKECPGCRGLGYTEGSEGKFPCRRCNVPRGLFGQQETQGKETCPECNGKGALVVLPQTAERRPTSGVIKSVGEEVSKCPICKGSGRQLVHGVAVTIVAGSIPGPMFAQCPRCKGEGEIGLKLRVGDRVIYPIFAGTAINFKQKGTARIMHENEVMGKLYGTGSIGDVIK